MNKASLLIVALCTTIFVQAQTKRIYNAMLANPSESFNWSSMDNAGAIMEYEDFPQFKISADSSQFNVKLDSSNLPTSDSTKTDAADTTGLGFQEKATLPVFNNRSNDMLKVINKAEECTQKRSLSIVSSLNKTIEPIKTSQLELAEQKVNTSEFGFSYKHWLRWILGGFILILIIKIKPGFG